MSRRRGISKRPSTDDRDGYDQMTNAARHPAQADDATLAFTL
jgi:hypothetical protein